MTPFEFELMGRTIEVKFKPRAYFDEHSEDLYGCWLPHSNLIYILEDLSDDQKWHTFYHEFCHAAFESMGYFKLSKDESLVDMMGSLIQQMLKTMDRHEATSARHRNSPE